MKNITLALENIRSLHNIGAIIRTCVFLGFEELILIGYSGIDPYEPDFIHKNIEKTSLGTNKHIKLQHFDNIQEFSDEYKNHKIIAIDNNIQDTQDLFKFTFEDDTNYILLLGNEVDGLSKDAINISENILEIPKLGQHSSLNVATTAGIVLSYTSYSKNYV